MSSTFWISDTRITSWYDDRRICNTIIAIAGGGGGTLNRRTTKPKKEGRREGGDPSPDLDGVVLAVAVREAERAEGAVSAVETVHVALAPLRFGVELALRKEPGRQQRPQPRRPPPCSFLRPSSSLFPIFF